MSHFGDGGYPRSYQDDRDMELGRRIREEVERGERGPSRSLKASIVDHLQGKSIVEAYRYCRRCQLAVPCSLRYAIVRR